MPVLQNNLSAERAVRFVQAASKDLESSLIKLTSGNRLADPAKHSTEALIASRYRSQIQRLQAGRENLSGALSLSQTQQGYLQQVGVVLSRMGELALRAMDVTMGDQQSGGDERRFEVVTGTFTFRRAQDFAKCVASLVGRNGRVNGEFYVDSLIEDALRLGLSVRIFDVDHYIGWGTPNDLMTFQYWQSTFHKWESHPYGLGKDKRIPAGSLERLEHSCTHISPRLPDGVVEDMSDVRRAGVDPMLLINRFLKRA